MGVNSLPVPVREGFLEEAGAQWGMTVVEVSLGQSLSLSLSLRVEGLARAC